MSDYNQFGKVFVAMTRLAVAGAIASLVMTVIGIIGLELAIYWAFHHVVIK